MHHAHCDQIRLASRGTRRLALALASAAALAGAGGMAAAPARADGDPASDVLATQALFVPWDAGIPAAKEAQLTVLLAAASRSGYPIRAAIIASASDLGSVTQLWRQPQEYAELLGEELSLVYRGTLLVIMPNGFGLYQQDRTAPPPGAALAGVRAPSSAEGLASASVVAVEHLAAAAGHPLRAAAVGSVAGAPPAALTPWLVFGVGCALIAAAWASSLRARPVRGWRPPNSGRA